MDLDLLDRGGHDVEMDLEPLIAADDRRHGPESDLHLAVTVLGGRLGGGAGAQTEEGCEEQEGGRQAE